VSIYVTSFLVLAGGAGCEELCPGGRGLMFGLERAQRFEVLALVVAEVLGELDVDAGEEVTAGGCRAQDGHPFAFETDLAAVLSELRDAERNAAGHGRDFDFAAEDGIGVGDVDIDVEIIAFAFEAVVGEDGDDEIEVAVRSASHTGAAFAGDTDAGARLDAGGHFDLKASRADDLAHAITGVAGGASYLAGAATCGTGLLRLQAEGAGGAVEGFFEGDLDGGFDVLAAAGSWLAAGAAALAAEEVIEDGTEVAAAALAEGSAAAGAVAGP
jgi:hypothetical protein